MTEPPPMVPSVGDRTATVLAHLHNGHHEPGIVVGQAIEEAHRDGFAAGVQAERARIIAACREKWSELIEIGGRAEYDGLRADPRFKAMTSWEEIDEGTRDVFRVRAIFAYHALADHLEHQTATPAHPGGS